VAPMAARLTAVSLPMPAFDPVMTTTLPFISSSLAPAGAESPSTRSRAATLAAAAIAL
jgi:hypothetical protein